MSNRDHQEPRDPGHEGQEFEPFMLDIAGPTSSPGASSSSGQFSGAEMEFEPFMFNQGEAENAGPFGSSGVSSAPEPAPAPAPTPAPSPAPVTGHSVPPPSYLTSSPPNVQPQAETAPSPANGSAHGASSPDLSSMMMGRSRGHTGPLSAERLGSAPASWSDHSLASIEDFSAVLIAVQAGRKLLQSGPLRAALPSPAAAGAQAQAPSNASPMAAATMQQPQNLDMGQVPQWAAQAGQQGADTATATATAAPPPFIAGADPSSPWAMDQPEWASGASHASAPSAAVAEDEDDSGLPPWLTEEDDTPAQSAAPDMQPAVRQAEERPELVSSTFTGTTGVGIQPPESTLHEPALETDSAVSGVLQSMDESQPGGLGGEDIEFEGFMFDQGTPAPIPNLRGEEGVATMGAAAPFNPPSQASPAGMVVDQDGQVEGGEVLPFWLNDAAEVEVTPGQGYVEAAEAAAHAGDPLVMGSVTPADAPDEDFADLPPVQPFDFTEIEGVVEHESLGFNTEELIGMQQGERDPMVVTANLEALADLIGGPLPAGIDPRIGKGAAPAGTASVDDGAPGVEADEQAQALDAEDEAEDEDEAEAFEVQPFEAEDMGWMSTVTTDLAASGLVEPTSALPPMPVAEQDSTGLSGVLDVSPFDINDLDVEEESSTSLLDQTPAVGPNTDKLEARQVSNAPATSPRLDEEYESNDAETATSIFAGPMSDLDEQYDDGESPTSRLATAEGSAAMAPEETWAPEAEAPEAQAPWAEQQAPPDVQTASPAPEQPEAGFFKARVARGQWSSNVPLVVPQTPSTETPQHDAGAEAEAARSPWAGGQTGMHAEAQAPAEVQAQAPAQEQEAAFEMPRPGDPTVSGPLPVLTGYEDLVELMEKNPQDIGSYMAMATAYVNSGELESALRVYRRLIKRPGVSATLLGMVDEELEELKASAGEMARYHQVRGDLFLKLGRHREAIDEYNKLV